VNPDGRGRTDAAGEEGRGRTGVESARPQLQASQTAETRSRIAQLREDAARSQFNDLLNQQLRQSVALRNRADALPGGRGASAGSGSNSSAGRPSSSGRRSRASGGSEPNAGRGSASPAPRSRSGSSGQPRTSSQPPPSQPSSPPPRSREPSSSPPP